MIKSISTSQQAEELSINGYINIHEFLDNEFINNILVCLSEEVKWGLATFIDGKSELFLNTNDTNLLDKKIQLKLKEQQHQDEFQFIYNSYMMVTAYIQNRDPGLFLHSVLEWLNSANVLRYFESLTQSKISKINAQATRYLPGHHLTQHNDTHSGEKRSFAYVLGLTKYWKPEWGGILQIIDSEGHITKSVIPEYNQLTVFKVPQNHLVSMVTPLAQTERLSLTGWLQA